jgi:hypothetical protein
MTFSDEFLTTMPVYFVKEPVCWPLKYSYVELHVLPCGTTALYNTIIELSLPVKVPRLIEMCLKDACSLVCKVNISLVKYLFKAIKNKDILWVTSACVVQPIVFSSIHYECRMASKDESRASYCPLRRGHIVRNKGCSTGHDARIHSVFMDTSTAWTVKTDK